MRGAGYDQDGMRHLERSLFGGTGEANEQAAMASQVRCLLVATSRTQTNDWRVLTHLDPKDSRRSPQETRRAQTAFVGYPPGIRLRLEISRRPRAHTESWHWELAQALTPVAFALGGMGLRSRRGFGTLSVEGSPQPGSAIDKILSLLEQHRNVGPSEPPHDVPVLGKGRAVVLEAERKSHVAHHSPGDHPVFSPALSEVMRRSHEQHRKGLAGPTFGKIGSRARNASAIHVRIFTGQDRALVRATIFALESRREVSEGLKSWAEGLELRPVWGQPWWS